MVQSSYAGVYPSDPLVVSYIALSTLTLTLCWLLAPLLIYVILTQSNSLGKFKWLILNHSLWCLGAETVYGIVKPIMLMPACAGYQAGFLRNYGDFRSSALSGIITIVCSVNAVVGLFWTLAARYLSVFPSWIQEFTQTRGFVVFFVLLHVPIQVCLFLVVTPMFRYSTNDMHVWAEEYDSGLGDFFVHQTFLIIPHANAFNSALLAVLIVSAFVIIGAIVLIVIFVRSVYQFRHTHALDTNFSILTSSMIQIGAMAGCLMFPLLIFVAFVRFDVVNSAIPMALLMHLLCLHCLLDFCTTLYFVAPYRRFLIRKFRQLIRKPAAVTSQTNSSGVLLRARTIPPT